MQEGCELDANWKYDNDGCWAEPVSEPVDVEKHTESYSSENKHEYNSNNTTTENIQAIGGLVSEYSRQSIADHDADLGNEQAYAHESIPVVVGLDLSSGLDFCREHR